MSEPVMRVRVVVSGRVQGVGFRYSTISEGRRMGLLGWVRNTADGDVEIVAEGPAAAVRQLVAWCSVGPPSARVDRVDCKEMLRDHPLAPFSVRW